MALACFVAARLAAECAAAMDDDLAGRASRAARCAGAKAWLGTLVVPATIRGSVAMCAELSIEGNPADMGREVARLLLAATSYLDAQSRTELNALSVALRG